MVWLFTAALFIAVIVYVGYPFLTETQEAAVRERKATERERVLKAKQDVIANLKDIEMDYRMGKLSDEDYSSLKADYEERAVAVFQEMESVGVDPRTETGDREA